MREEDATSRPEGHRGRGTVRRETLRQAQRRYDALLEGLVDGVVAIDHRGTVVQLNPAAEAIFGYRVEELLGRDVRVLMPTPYRDEHGGYIDRYRRTGERRIIGLGREVSGRRKDGSTFPMELAVVEVPDDDEVSFFGIVRDITAREEAERAMSAERDFAESLVETARTIVLVLDVQGRIVRYNRYLEALTDIPLDRVRGRPFADTFTPSRDREAWLAAFERALGGQPTTGAIHAIRDSAGNEHQIEWFDALLRDASGEVSGLLAVGQDISARLRLEEQFRQAQKMEAVGHLAGGIAHDFNTLLGSITGYSEMLLESEEVPAAIRHAAAQINRAADRGAALTRQLLAFSRRQVVSTETLDVNHVLGDVEDMLRRLSGDDITVVIDRAEGAIWVDADAGQLEQVIMNLVVNAVDAIAGFGRITIRTGVESLEGRCPTCGETIRPGQYLRLQVVDDGSGIPGEILDRVFEPFFTTKEAGKGTGLGLATVYGIVKQRRGCVGIESEPGHGTTVSVYLPVARTAGRVESAEPEKADAAGGTETVLLVEDDAMFLELLHDVLAARGYRVLAAGTPREALELVARDAPAIDLLVSDIVMPGMSGTVLATRLLERTPGLKVLLMSGYTDEDLQARGVDQDATYIHKPFSTNELARTVRRLLDT